MRRFVVLCAFATAMSAAAASAGLIYGTVRFGDKPVGEGTVVAIKLASTQALQAARTDKKGIYRANVSREGRCELTVTYGGTRSNTIVVYSYAGPAQCNLVLQWVNDRLTVRRE